MGMTRAQAKVEVVYVTPDGLAFWTPDGEGRYWFDSLALALNDHPDGPDAPVEYLEADPEDY